MKRKCVYQLPRLESALDSLVALVNEKGEVGGYELSRTFNAWRDSAKRLWLLDKARSRGIDFRVDGFSAPGKPMMTVFKRV